MSQQRPGAPAELRALVALSEESLAVARWALQQEYYRSAVSRAYYALFDVAKALLLTKGVSPRSHAGAGMLFGQHFVKTGQVPREYGRWFSKALKARLEADYEESREFTREEAQETLDVAEQLLQLARPRLLAARQAD